MFSIVQNQSDSPEMLKYHRTQVMATNSCSNIDESKQFICTNDTIEITFPELDQGSALISFETGELIGIASWNDDDEFQNVYVRIRTHLPWIRSVIIE